MCAGADGVPPSLAEACCLVSRRERAALRHVAPSHRAPCEGSGRGAPPSNGRVRGSAAHAQVATPPQQPSHRSGGYDAQALIQSRVSRFPERRHCTWGRPPGLGMHTRTPRAAVPVDGDVGVIPSAQLLHVLPEVRRIGDVLAGHREGAPRAKGCGARDCRRNAGADRSRSQHIAGGQRSEGRVFLRLQGARQP